jgi:hypothetical protein
MGLPIILPISASGWSRPWPVHVRIISTYPADFGLPEETVDLTLRVPASFARTPEEASRRIKAALETGADFEVPSVDDAVPFEFSSELVRRVAVW